VSLILEHKPCELVTLIRNHHRYSELKDDSGSLYKIIR